MILILIIVLLGALSFVLTFFIQKFRHRKMLAVPNERSLHEFPVPKGGGIAIVISWFLGITAIYLYGSMDRSLYLALMSGIMIAVVSLIDDIFDVKPFIRLIVHFLTAITAFYFLGGLRPLIIPEIHFNYNFIVYPIAITGIVWFINLYNFMDGVDGFASVQAIIISAVFFVFTWNIAAILLIVCIGGFLSWNWPKASIFMGDTGSTQLGFILVILGIYFHNTFEFSILNWIMLTSPFWFDATLTLFRRWRNREQLSKAHRKHVYQRVVQMGYSHARVNFFLIVINIINIIFISIYRELKALQVPLFALTLGMYYAITLWVDRRVPFKKD
jgi:Fuc2NAc and GlcNAc transferase